MGVSKKTDAPEPGRGYFCTKVTAKPTDSGPVYRYSFAPVGAGPHAFSSIPGGELSFLHVAPSLYKAGESYDLFPVNE